MVEIRLHNTATRKKEPFTPLNPKDVRMYVCGPTVYDRAHLGNARPVVVFDVLARLLRHVYGDDHVTYVRNITDVEDKINARAAQEGRTIDDLTAETTGWYHEDMAALGNRPPDKEPRATDYIRHMVNMIGELIEKGHAYEAEGHVLFDVRTYEDYGKLSGRSVDDMIAGARVEVAPYKRDPMDFVLWKPAGDGPGWPSPWGEGRPGWHIECSAMAKELLGEVFDIHGGGIDLQFPHHENEIAQSNCAHGTKSMAHYWLHNEMLQVEGKKMSKSLGNFFTVRDLLDQGYPGEVIRFVLLTAHYSKPMDWTANKADEVWRELEKFSVQMIDFHGNSEVPVELVDALADDLNTPKALTVLRMYSKTGNLSALNGALTLLGLELPTLRVPDTGDSTTTTFNPAFDHWLKYSISKSDLEPWKVDYCGKILTELSRDWALFWSEKEFALADQRKSEIEKIGASLSVRRGDEDSLEINLSLKGPIDIDELIGKGNEYLSPDLLAELKKRCKEKWSKDV